MIYLKGNKLFWNIGQKLRKKNNDYAKKKIIWIISLYEKINTDIN